MELVISIFYIPSLLTLVALLTKPSPMGKLIRSVFSVTCSSCLSCHSNLVMAAGMVGLWGPSWGPASLIHIWGSLAWWCLGATVSHFLVIPSSWTEMDGFLNWTLYLWTVFCTLHTVHWTLYLCIVSCTLYLCSMSCTLYTVHWTYVVCPVYCTLYTGPV